MSKLVEPVSYGVNAQRVVRESGRGLGGGMVWSGGCGEASLVP